jgi:hypothetical protein
MITDDGIQLRHTAGSSWMPAMTSRACFGAAGRAASRSTSSPQGIEGLFYQPQLRWRIGLDEHGSERGAEAAAAGVQLISAATRPALDAGVQLAALAAF